MRINKWLAHHSMLSRRAADEAISQGRIGINGRCADLGDNVGDRDSVTLDGREIIATNSETTLVMLNKPTGFVCSRRGQGSKTIYELLPKEYQGLNPVGRLDKDSSGLLLLTNDGNLLNTLAHPSARKEKVYEVTLSRPLGTREISELIKGVNIGDDRPSRLKSIEPLHGETYRVALEEGRNRQIRRTFEAIGHNVQDLHRTTFGTYVLGTLKPGAYQFIEQ